MEELDLLKKDWKRAEGGFAQVSEQDIYKMIHKSSSSIVKWILIIGIAEVIVWTLINTLGGTDEYLRRINSEEFTSGLKMLTYVNYAVIVFFIYLFYRNYVTISTVSNTRQLMKDILRTRRTVKYYVWYNLGMIALSLIVGFVVAIVCSPEVAGLKDKMMHDNVVLMKTIGVLLIVLLICLAVVWVFYRLVYGTLMRKLLVNYKELKKIDL